MSAPQNDPAETPPAPPWYTEEMLEMFLRSWNGMHVGTAPDRIRAALDAIAPMVTKWVGDLQASEGEMMRQAGYEAGCRKGRRVGEMFGREDGYILGYNQAVKDLS